MDFSMSTGLDASTVTPGSTAPDVSFTTPVIEPWASATAGIINIRATHSSKTAIFGARIRILLQSHTDIPPYGTATAFRPPKTAMSRRVRPATHVIVGRSNESDYFQLIY